MNKDIQNENYDLNFSEFYELYLKEIGRKSGLFLCFFRSNGAYSLRNS